MKKLWKIAGVFMVLGLIVILPQKVFAVNSDTSVSCEINLENSATYDYGDEDNFGKALEVSPNASVTLKVSNVENYFKNKTNNETSTFQYQWYEKTYDGTASDFYSREYKLLAGQTQSEVTVTMDRHKDYQLIISDKNNNATVTVNFYVYITNKWQVGFYLSENGKPSSADEYKTVYYVEEGATPTIVADISENESTTSFTYQWYKYDEESDCGYSLLTDSTGNTLMVDGITEATSYQCIIQDNYGNTNWGDWYVSATRNGQNGELGTNIVWFGIEGVDGYDDEDEDICTDGDFQYKILADETIEIVKYTGSESNLQIPGKIQESQVTRIRRDAFFFNKDLTSVTIPQSVVTISGNPFGACDNLKKIIVDLNNPRYSSGKNNNVIIDKNTYELVSSCSGSVIPSDITSIGWYALAWRNDLTSIDIPQGVTTIGEGAFYNSTALTTIVLPSSVTSIGVDAFDSCYSLKEVTIPNSVTSIAWDPFYDCPALTTIYVTSGSYAETWAKENGYGDKLVITEAASQPTPSTPSSSETPTPSTPTTSETPTTPTSGSTTQNTQTTDNQSTETTLPAVGSTEKISGVSYKVTKSSAEKKEVTFTGRVSKTKTSVKVPDTVKIDGQIYKVTAISDKAFKNNSKLKSVTIGKNITKIGKEAFSGCKKLSKITIKSTKLKSVSKNALKGINAKATIKVPKKQLSAYKKLFNGKAGFKKTMKIKK
jgi:hypothetical protein